jgi:hypothetical protein
MKQLWRFLAVSAGPGIVVFVALVGYTAIDVYVLGNFDPKFGRFGSVQLAAFISGLMFACSFSGHLLACVIFRTTVFLLRGWWLFGVVAGLILGQGALLASLERLLPESITSTMAVWAAVSCGIALGILYVVRRWPPNNSFKPTPLCGAA